MTEMKGNFYSNFTSNLGFAILAFYDKKLVKYLLEIKIKKPYNDPNRQALCAVSWRGIKDCMCGLSELSPDAGGDTDI